MATKQDVIKNSSQRVNSGIQKFTDTRTISQWCNLMIPVERCVVKCGLCTIRGALEAQHSPARGSTRNGRSTRSATFTGTRINSQWCNLMIPLSVERCVVKCGLCTIRGALEAQHSPTRGSTRNGVSC
ncbi:hypothetical protein J6590_011904 [Homalodisca vitripennis]|nr:hypothetical protein J6590_011904 [Homalodisca vitripennis]